MEGSEGEHFFRLRKQILPFSGLVLDLLHQPSIAFQFRADRLNILSHASLAFGDMVKLIPENNHIFTQLFHCFRKNRDGVFHRIHQLAHSGFQFPQQSVVRLDLTVKLTSVRDDTLFLHSTGSHTISSPGGMADGTRIQERDITNISSTRRNPVLADVFARLGYMERQGSGFKKITEAYYAAHNYRAELEPKFYSDGTSFQVTLYNLNYGTAVNASNVSIGEENVAIDPIHVAIEVAIEGLIASPVTIGKAKAVFASMGTDGIFGRSDIAAITNDSVTAAGNLITKLKNACLIEAVNGYGKGKYKFVEPQK